MEVSKVVQKEDAKAKVEECRESIEGCSCFWFREQRVRAGLPSCWDLVGGLIPWEQYSQMLVETKSRVDSSHEKTSTLKGKTMENYLRRDSQLLGLVKTLFRSRQTIQGSQVLRSLIGFSFALLNRVQHYGRDVTSSSTLHYSRSMIQQLFPLNWSTMNEDSFDHANYDTSLFYVFCKYFFSRNEL